MGSSRRHGTSQVIQTAGTKLDEQFEEFSLSLPDDVPDSFSEQVQVSPRTNKDETGRPTPAASAADRLQPLRDEVNLKSAPSPAPRHAQPVEAAAPRYAQPVTPATQSPQIESTYDLSPVNAMESSAESSQRLAAQPMSPTPVAAIPAEPKRAVFSSAAPATAHWSVPASSSEVVTVSWSTPKEVNRGETIACDLQVTNAGELPAMAVEVHVKLPDNVVLSDADQTPDVDGRLLTWHVGRLAAHETKTFRLGLQSNAEGDLAPMAAVTFTHAATAKIQVNNPKLSVVIEGPAQTVVAQPATYHVHVSNPGTGHVRNVVLQTRLDGQLLHAQNPNAEYAVGTLGPGESRLLELPLTALEPGSGAIAVLASATGSLRASDEHSLEAVRPTVKAKLDGPKRRFVGRPAVYTLTVHNPTPAPASNVQLFGGVPSGFRFVQASHGGSYDEGQGLVAWFVGRLEPQESREVTFELETSTPGNHQVVAAVRADAGIDEQLTAQTEVEGLASVVLEVADIDDPVEASGQTAYQIRVSNRGSKAASGVQVAAIIPAEMEALRIGGPAEGTITDDRIVFATSSTRSGRNPNVRSSGAMPSGRKCRFRAFLRTDEQPEPIQQDEVTRVYQD